MICAACFAWLVALYYAVTMSGLLITVVQEERRNGTTYPPNDFCNIVRHIPLGTLCILGGLGLFFSVVSIAACCCFRVAGSFSF